MINYFVAFDPGANGAMCILGSDNSTQFWDFKTSNISGYTIALSTVTPALVAIEAVSSMPGQGVKSMFSFGQRLGELEGMLQALNIGYVKPRPREWQKVCRIKPKSGKKGIYDVISKIYPKAILKGSRGGLLDGRCDALGIAHYLRTIYNN